MELTQAKELVATLAAIYDVPAWENPRLRAFARSIVDLEYEPCAAAVSAWIKCESRRPQPSDIREATRQQLDRVGAVPHDPDEDEAASTMFRLAREVGSYNPFPATQHPAIWEAIQAIGGWNAVCHSQNREALRAHFGQAYRIIIARRRDARNSAPQLRLADDGERLAIERSSSPQLDRPAILQLPARTEEDRSRGLSAVRAIIDSLTPSAKPAATAPVLEVEPEAYREPMEAEVLAATERREVLRRQAAELADRGSSPIA